ncbi:GNAT family N-acetyltransferase [Oceanobacillus sp. AG]|uniref:GNAT family N-acetyltransferase n=1 Tax=Oceanobacillus sp. AG TaxID=2681969 RepID=UPI0012EC4407|nr:GNAT family protein [Oceanobacillus sp. AG]
MALGGDKYYIFENFTKKNKALLDEQSKGLSYFYLIKNEDGLILGRINLVNVDKNQGTGHIGYRVGESYIGKGIANKSVNLLLTTINKQEIKEILAKTTTDNIASQRVLEKNGFKHIATSDETFEMNGESLRFIYYKWTN